MRAFNISDLRDGARRRLPRGLFEFVDGGSEDGLAMKANRAAFDAIQIQPRVLVDVSRRSQECMVLGKSSAMPIAISPTGAAGLVHFDGEVAIALAARRAGIPFTLSTASIVAMERIAQEAGGRLWFQLYMWPDRRMSYQLIDRARRAGFEALIVTVDSPVSPNREYNARNGMTLPLRINRSNVGDVLMRPRWLLSVMGRYLMRDGIPMMQNYPDALRRKLTDDATAGKNVSLPKNDSLTWDDLREIRKAWSGALIIKGVLHPADAVEAVQCGVDGIIVSNHGGRNLDSAVPAIVALPAVVEAANGRAEIFLDSGVRRGSDVVKAVALGAKSVFVGRAPLWGVACGGESGALAALEIFRDEIDRTMALAGSPDFRALSWYSADPRLARYEPAAPSVHSQQGDIQ